MLTRRALALLAIVLVAGGGAFALGRATRADPGDATPVATEGAAPREHESSSPAIAGLSATSRVPALKVTPKRTSTPAPATIVTPSNPGPSNPTPAPTPTPTPTPSPSSGEETTSGEG